MKCRRERLIEPKELLITVIKRFEAKTQG
ncbi:MAG: hypothetical protein HFH61_04460 [Lachnospiraceae bacterium]|nr:hypothetical protein [Lachnospiraceae bacterium]